VHQFEIIIPSQRKLEHQNKMKNVAKIAVFLMAVTALEASRSAKPNEVSNGSSSRDVWA
jgi:hypothetical protein